MSENEVSRLRAIWAGELALSEFRLQREEEAHRQTCRELLDLRAKIAAMSKCACCGAQIARVVAGVAECVHGCRFPVSDTT